ncbi:iron complex transport system permease protein, partial [Streptomyces sp. Ncost-T6T-2b]
DLDQAMSAAAWGAGSLNGVSWDRVVVGGACIAVLLLLAGMLSRPLRQMQLGDEVAASQGLRVSPVRLGLILVGVALTATVTAASGPIAFISLVAPQIGRRLARTAGITLAPAAFVGALLCLASDHLAQHRRPHPAPGRHHHRRARRRLPRIPAVHRSKETPVSATPSGTDTTDAESATHV